MTERKVGTRVGKNKRIKDGRIELRNKKGRNEREEQNNEQMIKRWTE